MKTTTEKAVHLSLPRGRLRKISRSSPQPQRHPDTDSADGRIKIVDIVDPIGQEGNRYPDKVSAGEPGQSEQPRFAPFYRLIDEIAEGGDNQCPDGKADSGGIMRHIPERHGR